VLAAEPLRYQALPHMLSAQWDCLELIMESLARDYPEHFSLTREGNRWRWINRALEIDDSFMFGDAASLPREPLDYITRQAQGDFVVMDQRDGDLWTEAGMVTTPADWSLDFDIGMTFKEWHGPVPLAHEIGVFDRALKYLLNLRLGQPVRRLNWTMTVNPRLDTSPENYPKWGPERATVTPQNAGALVHLRVEMQSLWRLPRSNGVLFGIRCYLISLNELVTVPKWGRRIHRALKSLHPALVEYKGLTRYRDTVVDWLARHDDGAPTTPGTAPD
jgi:dimethylamine monooxygenase subunit A